MEIETVVYKLEELNGAIDKVRQCEEDLMYAEDMLMDARREVEELVNEIPSTKTDNPLNPIS